MTIKYPIETTWLDYPDNESLSVILYVLGCDNNCLDCHNSDFKYKEGNNNTTIIKPVSIIADIVKQTVNTYITDKLVITGGDPLEEFNVKEVKELLFLLHSYYYNINKKLDICIYTGKDIDYVKRLNLKYFTYIKCGNYRNWLKQESEKTNEYIQFASSNQKLYDSNFNLLSKNGRYYFESK